MQEAESDRLSEQSGRWGARQDREVNTRRRLRGRRSIKISLSSAKVVADIAVSHVERTANIVKQQNHGRCGGRGWRTGELLPNTYPNPDAAGSTCPSPGAGSALVARFRSLGARISPLNFPPSLACRRVGWSRILALLSSMFFCFDVWAGRSGPILGVQGAPRGPWNSVEHRPFGLGPRGPLHRRDPGSVGPDPPAHKAGGRI